MARSYTDYIAMGMDEKTARYFSSGRRRICVAEPKEGFRVNYWGTVPVDSHGSNVRHLTLLTSAASLTNSRGMSIAI